MCSRTYWHTDPRPPRTRASCGLHCKPATLHNADIVAQRDVRIGDYVVIQKVGDVIPEIVRSRQNGAQGKKPRLPCPVSAPLCGSEVVRLPGEAATRCVNKARRQQQERIIHFASRGPWTSRGWASDRDQLISRACEKRADLYR